MAKLHWAIHYDEYDNVYLEAESPYQDDGVPILWRLRRRFCHNRLEWYNASDDELYGTVDGTCWLMERDAREAVQKAHDQLLSDQEKKGGAK